jgi:hypothetical protein
MRVESVSVDNWIGVAELVVPSYSIWSQKLLSTITNTQFFTAGTFEDPIIVRSAGEELQCGCTGSPADSHVVRWCVVCSVALSFQFVVLTNATSGVSTPTIRAL